MQTALSENTRGSFEGAYGAAVLTGLACTRQAGRTVRVASGIAVNPVGVLMYNNANFDVVLTAPVGGLERALIVIRPKVVDNEEIVSPVDPNNMVFLRAQQSFEIIAIRGTVSNTAPEYPSKLATDTILCGVYLSDTSTLDGNIDIDYSVRDMPMKNASGLDAHGIWDDRLRPYKVDHETVAIKPAIQGEVVNLGVTNTRLKPLGRAYVAPGKPSKYPVGAFGEAQTYDIQINFTDGTISSEDALTPNFTPRIPPADQYESVLVGIDANETLQFLFASDLSGYSFSKNACVTDYLEGSVIKFAPDVKLLAFVILYSVDGTAIDDLMLFDQRHPGNVAITSLAHASVEITSDSTWTAPKNVNRVRLTLYQRKHRQANMNASSIAIDTDGAAWAWGLNASGELGTGNTTDVSSPIAVLGGKIWKQISIGNAVGGQYCLGIDSNDDGYAWGANIVIGNLGLGDLLNRSSPVIIPGGRKWRSIYAGPNGNSYGITTDGDGYSWGDNDDGEGGKGSTTNSSSPVAMVGGIKWKHFAPGINSCIGLAVDGSPYGMGSNTAGRAGLTASASSPVAIAGGHKFRDCWTGSVNSGYVYAVKDDGTAYFWGEGGWGFGYFTDVSSPVVAQESQKLWRMIHPGGRNVLGLTTEGEAYAWGDNAEGQLGNGTTTASSSPVAIIGGNKFAALYPSRDESVTDFSNSAIGLTGDGRLLGWGYNGKGQLGTGNTTNFSSPVAVVGARVFNSLLDVFLTQVDVDVKPETTYNLKLYPGFVSFAGIGIYTTKVSLKAVLEYTG